MGLKIMCELFALSSNKPVTLTVSLQALARHGRSDGPYKDGWGVAYYEQTDVRLIKDATAASESEWVRFIEGHRVCSTLIMSHLRKATQGTRTYSNTQPFVRELGGRMHIFAHNGNLNGLKGTFGDLPDRYHPVGDTDSEWAFCALLDQMADLWADSAKVPELSQRMALVVGFARKLRPLGPANFIYGDGDTFFAHGDRRTQTSGAVNPPGLCVLERRCNVPDGGADGGGISVDGLALELGQQKIALVASVPLTNEAWRPLDQGEVIALRDGLIVVTLQG